MLLASGKRFSGAPSNESAKHRGRRTLVLRSTVDRKSGADSGDAGFELMKLFGWIKGRESQNERERRRWRQAWTEAMAAEDAGRAATLRASLEGLQVEKGDDIEVELEMLDALEQLGRLREVAAAGSLPLVETHHRVVAGEICHFTAPATLPDDPSQASGRLLFTAARAIFVGGGRPLAIAWHAVRDVIQTDRDLLLVRAENSASHFRFNTYGDAVAAAFLARRLKGSRGARGL